MAKFFDGVTEQLAEFIQRQLIFFVATAPPNGRINLSPKGVDALRVLDANTLAWIDLGGSGNETAAHLIQDDRITLMLCSFGGKPLIVRLYGHGRAIQRRHAEWARYAPLFEGYPAARQIMVMRVESTQTSCGYGVPRAEELTPRKVPKAWTAEASYEEHEARFREQGQHESIDGLPTGLFEDPPT